MKSKLEPSEMYEGDGERAARAPEREGESAAPARPFKQEPLTTSDDGSLLDATHAVKQEADIGQSNLVELKLESVQSDLSQFKQEPLTTSDDGSLLDAAHAVKQEADIDQFNLVESKLESVQSDLSQFKQEPLTTSEDGSLLAAAHTVKQEADIGQFNLFESKLESVQSDLSQTKQEPPDTCGDVSSVDAKLDAEIKIEISHSIYRPSRAMEHQSVEEEHSGATDQVNGAGWSTGAAGGASGAGCGVLGDCRSSSACGSRGVCRYRGVRTFRGAHRARGGCRGPRRVWPVSRTTSADQIEQRTVEQSVQHAPGTPTTSYTDKRLELAGAPEIEPVTTELTPVTSPMPKRQLHKISPKNMLRLGDKLIWTGLNTGSRKACLARQVWPDSPTSTVQTKLGTEGQNFESATAATPLTTSVMPVIVSIQTLKSQPSSGRDEPAPPLKRPLEVGGNDSSVTPKRRMERPLESATSSSQSVSPSPPDSKIVSSRPENHKVIGSSCYDASSGPESDVEDFMPHAGSEDDEVDSEVNHYRNRGLEWLSRDVQPDMGLVDPQLIRLAKAVNAIEDEAIDRELPSTESIFEWSSDFTQFHGKKGAFISTTGPTIPTIDPLEIFLSIWDEEIMTKIVEATNEYATQGIASRKFPSKYQWKPTSISEMYLLFSIFVYQSVVTLALEKEYFGSNSFYGSVNCTPAIKYKRYIFLKKFLHFVNDSATKPVTGDAEAASAGQPLAAVAMLGKLQPVIDHCNAKFQSLYKLKQNLYIDESLTRWKGRLSWLQYIKTKHARFGVKSYELCESSSGYMWKFFIYADKSDSTSIQLCENIGASEGTGATSIALLKLVQDHNHMGHVLYLDYFYNSPALARILKNRGIDCVGTLWLDRKNVPSAVSEPTPDSMSRGQVIAVHSGDVAVMAWKDMKKVGMISTYHGPTFNDASQAGQGIRKPDIVLDYNKHMAGVNVKACDQRLSSFQLERHNKKWYMKMFHRLLNASLLNCYIIYSANFYRLKVGGKPLCLLTHREFRHKIVDALFRRFSARGTDQHRQPQPPPSINLRPILPQNHFQILLPQDSMQTKYRRCRACSIRGIRANSKYCCDLCNVPLCLGQCFKDYHTLKSLI